MWKLSLMVSFLLFIGSIAGTSSFLELYKDPRDSVSCSFGGIICGPGCCDSLLGWHCCCVVTDTDIEWLCAARKVECPSS